MYAYETLSILSVLFVEFCSWCHCSGTQLGSQFRRNWLNYVFPRNLLDVGDTARLRCAECLVYNVAMIDCASRYAHRARTMRTEWRSHRQLIRNRNTWHGWRFANTCSSIRNCSYTTMTCKWSYALWLVSAITNSLPNKILLRPYHERQRRDKNLLLHQLYCSIPNVVRK
jgi:hypothetical protein